MCIRDSFGTALALSLADAGKEVLVLDNSETKIKEMSKYIDNAFIMSHYDKDSLMEAGVQNCHTVIVGVGSQIEVSIMTTMNLIELGVPRVIAKCVGSDHGNVLKKLGAEVVFPEKDMAVKLARSLVGTRAMDYIDLSETISIEEHAVTDKMCIRDSHISMTLYPLYHTATIESRLRKNDWAEQAFRIAPGRGALG